MDIYEQVACRCREVSGHHVPLVFKFYCRSLVSCYLYASDTAFCFSYTGCLYIVVMILVMINVACLFRK